ncbi:MAG: hypothetical protein FWG19_03550, partial [Methanomassiliicoccaceae archaeon]|nr:hypothetical protein [Methanomassiliicoccaceae archaeon]
MVLMKIHELKGMYGRGDRSAISEAYTEVLKETPGSGEELAFLAADHAHGEALALLFGSGVSPAVSDKYGFNLLHYLARQPESKYNIKPPGAIRKAAEILLDNKVSP